MALFNDKSIHQITGMLAQKKISAVEIAQESIKQYTALEQKVQAWVCFNGDKLLSEAKAADARLSDGQPVRSLEAVPIGVKDIMNTIDFPTQMGSPIWKDFTPGNDARVVFSLKQEGGLVPGKTVTAEFAVHTLGKTLNPHDVTRTPGTSSSGSAVAVATAMVPAALATQTAGSIVRPASFCGIYGCKPSFGLIPRTGLLKTTDSLDTVGFMAYHYEDLKNLFEVFRVHGHNYPVSDTYLSDTSLQSAPSGRPWKIAFVRTRTWKNLPDQEAKSIEEWIARLSREKDIEIHEVELPAIMQKSHEVHATIYDKTLAYYFNEEFKKAELVSPIMNRLIAHGNKITVSEYQAALNTQEEMWRAMDGFLDGFDVMVSHATAGPAPLRDTEELPDPALMWTMTHLPVVHVPLFRSSDGLPFGMQITAKKYLDYKLLTFCDMLIQREIIPTHAQGVRL
ncbi:MAG: amidase [Candidatus Raymondbacteria bacterium RifOxyA12_full_50_37]|nr:MAG: amidase [Candidatus Raymondbacteria bacterium RifOxyA12_full_50_37]OGJ88517.1 MAG: amidase [Candidatus Raymondbacteria bacterium RIFOXYA2_FULL_49_16]OGJ98978.1 MAG: amidase [Candidatus Raymondbacteria bacterium RIFOXYC2_FULL_50_21]OGK00615.1 MAG: amidase [Candidatus Raymondbacteria bacterium RifOxyC12_full_50_8]OGP41488.1 MAG: amidase [Candidatus Raymondbacteria bacterium RIFOXYB2_FULL_49_35]